MLFLFVIIINHLFSMRLQIFFNHQKLAYHLNTSIMVGLLSKFFYNVIFFCKQDCFVDIRPIDSASFAKLIILFIMYQFYYRLDPMHLC
jgi:hypothetical protein